MTGSYPRRRPGDARATGTGPGAGLALGLLSALCFGTSGTFGSALVAAGWSPAGAVLARVAVAALVLTGPALLTLRGRWALLRRSARQVVTYGLVGVAACQVCYFNAIARMDVGISILLEYLGIVLIVGWLWAARGQRPRLLTVLGGLAALGGLGLMLDLSGRAASAWPAWPGPWPRRWRWRCTSSCRPRPRAPTAAALPRSLLTWGGMVRGPPRWRCAALTGLVPLRFAARRT